MRDIGTAKHTGRVMDLNSRASFTPSAAPLLYGVPGVLLTVLVFLIGATLTGVAWRTTTRVEEQRARDALAVHATDVQNSIDARLLAYKGVLRAGVGVIDAFWPISREQWANFAAQMRLTADYPGIHGLGFAAALHSQADVERWRPLLPMGIHDHPHARPSNQPPESAIVLLEPADARNMQAMGFNMMSEATRREAMELARDTGKSVLTGPLVLLQELAKPKPQPGFVLYVPVYTGGITPSDVAERRRRLRGFVYSAYRAGEFFANALNVSPAEAIFEVFDGAPTQASLLYRNAPTPPDGAFYDQRTLSIGGRDWTLRVWPSAEASRAPRSATMVAITGAVTTLLIVAIIAMLTLRSQRLHDRMEASRAWAEREKTLKEQLEQRVSERTAALETANRELSAANRDLETFTYTVSHDLRAPLRAVNGHVELFMASEDDPNQKLHHANSIRRNVTRMAQMIEDLLKLAFVSRRPLEKQDVALPELLRPVLDELRRTHPTLDFDVQSDALGEVHADSALLQQVFANLLLNAAKFSRNAPSPRVWIGVDEIDGERVYYVRDNGVGFDMKYAGKLFGVFDRLHHEREFEGSGVGLAIVKQIIERHDGRVWAQSEVGGGATFYFTLSAPTDAAILLRSAA